MIIIEQWKAIPSIINYEASNLGNIRHIKHKRILKPYIDSGGYLTVSIWGQSSKSKKVHILVAEAFWGECPYGKEVHHRDSNKLNPRADNLEYVTHVENCSHIPQVKLSKEEAKDIKQLYQKGGISYAKIATRYNVHPTTIRDVIIGKSFTGI